MSEVETAADYSAWLTPERLEVEERLWAEVAIYRLYAQEIAQVAFEERCTRVIEMGCGTGWVPTALPRKLLYTGVDANEDCLRLASMKQPNAGNAIFRRADIRDADLLDRHDLVCSFAVLKHFALYEWPFIVRKVLSLGRVGLFTMNVGEADTDDFEQGFPHTWVSRATLEEAVQEAGHRVVSTRVLDTTETMVRTVIA